MRLALVVGTVVATQKHDSLEGHKLLVVQPQKADGETPDGDPQIAVDGVGAGIGDEVVLTSDNRGAEEIVGDPKTPVRWTVVGICDE